MILNYECKKVITNCSCLLHMPLVEKKKLRRVFIEWSHINVVRWGFVILYLAYNYNACNNLQSVSSK